MRLTDLTQRDALTSTLKALATNLAQAASLINRQVENPNLTWMRGIRTSLSEKWEEPLRKILQDVRDYENNGHGVTWPRTSKERHASRHTMGIQLNKGRASSPIEIDDD